MKMVSMKRTAAMKKAAEPNTAPEKAEDGPDYPWGSRITVEDDHVDAMGLAGAGVGEELQIVGKGKVIGSRAEDRGSHKSRSVEIQITHMAISPLKKDPGTAEVLYGEKG